MRIFVIPRGGLGNILFCYFHALTLAEKTGAELCFLSSYQDSRKKMKEYQLFQDLSYTDVLPNLPVVKEASHYYQICQIPETSFILDGYWQCHGYFEPFLIRNKVLELAQKTGLWEECQKKYEELSEGKETVLLHVRRGDLVGLQETHPIPRNRYYEEALDKFPDNKILVFTDEPQFVKTWPVLDGRRWQLVEEENPEKAFLIMSLCTHFIIQNSTLSLSAYYFKCNPYSRIIAPYNWFGPRGPKFNIREIVPPQTELLYGGGQENHVVEQVRDMVSRQQYQDALHLGKSIREALLTAEGFYTLCTQLYMAEYRLGLDPAFWIRKLGLSNSEEVRAVCEKNAGWLIPNTDYLWSHLSHDVKVVVTDVHDNRSLCTRDVIYRQIGTNLQGKKTDHWHEEVDKILIINLPHREDRKKHILGVLREQEVPPHKVQFISALPVPSFGLFGCTVSHAMAVQTAIQGGWSRTLILEDDFAFHESLSQVNFKVKEALKEDFDVLLLAQNEVYPHKNISHSPLLKRCFDVQTASAYLITPRILPTLLSTLKEALLPLVMTRNTDLYANDMVWKTLQTEEWKWFCFHKPLGYQIDGHSDNVGRYLQIGKRY